MCYCDENSHFSVQRGGFAGSEKIQICVTSFMQREQHETELVKRQQPGLVHKTS